MLYHVTQHRHLTAILREGLVPRIGERSDQLGEAVPAIYLFPSRDDCDTALGGWLGECFEDLPEDALAILEIAPEGLWLAETAPYERISLDPIPASAIVRVLGEDFHPVSCLIEE